MCWLDYRPGRQRVTARPGKDWAGREEVAVSIDLPVLDDHQLRLLHEEPRLARRLVARQHLMSIFSAVHDRLHANLPDNLAQELDRFEVERADWKRRQDAEKHAAKVAHEAHQLLRSTEHIWRGRAPDRAVDRLILAVEDGKRYVALPQLIAQLRDRHHVAPEPDDAARLAEAGYSPEEIMIALGPNPWS